MTRRRLSPVAGAKDRLVKAPTRRSQHGDDFTEQKRTSMAAHRRQQPRQVGEIPGGA